MKSLSRSCGFLLAFLAIIEPLWSIKVNKPCLRGISHMTQHFEGPPSVKIIRQSADLRVALIEDSVNSAKQILAVTSFRLPLPLELKPIDDKIRLGSSIAEAFSSNGFWVQRRVVGEARAKLSSSFVQQHPNFSSASEMQIVELWVGRGDQQYHYATISEVYSRDFAEQAFSFDRGNVRAQSPLAPELFQRELSREP